MIRKNLGKVKGAIPSVSGPASQDWQWTAPLAWWMDNVSDPLARAVGFTDEQLHTPADEVIFGKPIEKVAADLADGIGDVTGRAVSGFFGVPSWAIVAGLVGVYAFVSKRAKAA